VICCPVKLLIWRGHDDPDAQVHGAIRLLVDTRLLPDSPCQPENVAYNFSSARRGEHFVAVNRSRDEARVSWPLRMAKPGIAIEWNYGDAVHSRFAGQELDLICNHKFV
jgi:hypothetical protein